MSDDPKLEEARKLIAAFAEKLLALNDGNAIPTAWNIHLSKALTPKPRKSGRKRDYAKTAEVVKRLALVGKKVRAERTKQHNPASFKGRIARDVGVSVKTVERIDKMRPGLMRELPRLDALAPELRTAVIDGIAAAICERLKADDEVEEKKRKQELRRLAKLLPPGV